MMNNGDFTKLLFKGPRMGQFSNLLWVQIYKLAAIHFATKPV